MDHIVTLMDHIVTSMDHIVTHLMIVMPLHKTTLNMEISDFSSQKYHKRLFCHMWKLDNSTKMETHGGTSILEGGRELMCN